MAAEKFGDARDERYKEDDEGEPPHVSAAHGWIAHTAPVPPWRAELNPYADIDKTAVLQEARVFHDATHVRLHPKRCCMLLTKLLYLLGQGETFAPSETTEVFFGVTKLFQSQDVRPDGVAA